jgi:cytochrome c
MMRIRLFHTRMAVVLMAAAVFLSGCYHWMSPHSRMDRSAAKSSWQVTKADRPGYTVAMVEKALRLYDAKGREATVAYYNSPQSVDGEWYVFIFDENDQLIAHANPDMLGEDLKGDLGVDITGYRHGEVIASATEEGMWVDYIFLNPVTGNHEYKHAWVVRHDGLIFVSGWYQVLPGLSLGVTKAQPAEYTVAMVDKAVRYYKAHGREEAVAYYNTPESVDGQWYVYICDENDLVIAHANPELLGQDLKEDLGLDSTGFRFGDEILKATEEGLWVDYVFLNPATGAEETKHAWTVRHDGVLIGSGWYE